MFYSAPPETHYIYTSRPVWSAMLNLPEAKVVWNHPAKDPESEFPGVKDPELPATPSLLSRLVPRSFTWPRVEAAEPEDTEGLLEEELSESDDEDVFTRLAENIKQNIQRPDSSMSDNSDSHEGDATSPIIIERGSRSTLAARRHLQRPPRNINVVSHSSSLHLRAPSSGDETVFPGPQPLPSSAGVARTPVTANLRWQIEEQIQDEDLMHTIDAYAEEKVKRDRKHHTPRQRTPAIAFDFALQAEQHKSRVAALRVRMLLVPAIFLLSQANGLRADEVEKALMYAHSAQQLAWSEDVEEALAARCAYYIGLASFLLLPKYVQYVSTRPSSIGSFSERGRPETVRMYFKQACEATGYEEAPWAKEWVEYLKDPEVQEELSRSAEEQRPTSANSWMTGWMRSLWGGKKSNQKSSGIKQPPQNILRGKRASVSSQKTDSTFKPDGPERIPSFESWHTDDSRPSSSASVAPSMDEYEPPQRISEEKSPRKRRPFTDDSDSDPKQPALPPPVTSPKTSPTNRISFAGARMSPILIGPTSSDSEVPVGSPTFQRRHSRRTSLLSMVTGRERRPSEIEQAEEGDSPYRPKFDSVPETSEGSKKRKPSLDGEKKRRESAEPEDIVYS